MGREARMGGLHGKYSRYSIRAGTGCQQLPRMCRISLEEVFGYMRLSELVAGGWRILASRTREGEFITSY